MSTKPTLAKLTNGKLQNRFEVQANNQWVFFYVVAET
jgi:hypothetical protein